MKIRYVITHGYGMGGTIRTIINQANAMAAVGHDVELVSVIRRRDTPFFPISESVRVVDLVDQRDRVRRPARRSWRGWRGWLGPEAPADTPGRIVPADENAYKTYTAQVEQAVAGYFGKLDDGVLVTSRPALNLLAARFCGPGVIRVGQEHMHLEKHNPGVRGAIRRHYGALDAIVTLTETDRAAYEAVFGASGPLITSIPNAVTVDCAPSTLDRPIVVAAGRLTPQKGFDLLIQAFEKVVAVAPDWQLRIYGSGPREKSLRHMIHERHLYNHVFLMGQTQDLGGQLAKASAFVLSSRFEGLPMVLIEAMAHGLPVASFDCPTGPADVITDGVEGLLAPPEDVDGLAAALLRLISDVELRRELGEAARLRAADFSLAVITPRWEALFDGLQARRTHPRRSPSVTFGVMRWRQAINKTVGLAGYRIVKASRPARPAASRPDHKPAERRDLPADYDEAAKEIIRAVRPYTMTSHEKLYDLILATRHVCRFGIPGAIVECGVWRGGSMQAVARTLLEQGDAHRDLYLFDTFEGMPPPSDKDRRHDGRTAADLLAAASPDAKVWAAATLEDVQAGLAAIDYPQDRMHFVRGMVEQTVPDQAPEQISILRLDTDWYESTRHELEHLYPRLVSGGVLIIDDYGWWQGSRQAVDEFLEKTGERLLLVRMSSGRIAVKP